MARDGVAKSIKKDRLIGRATTNQREEDVNGGGPEWTSADLAALTSELHIPDLAGGQVQISYEKRCSLRDASTRVVEEEEERMIAQALFRLSGAASRASISGLSR